MGKGEEGIGKESEGKERKKWKKEGERGKIRKKKWGRKRKNEKIKKMPRFYNLVALYLHVNVVIVIVINVMLLIKSWISVGQLNQSS